MIELIRFEICKIFRSNYTYILFGVLFLFLVSFFIFSHIQTEYAKDKIIELEQDIEFHENNLLILDKQLKEDASLQDDLSFQQEYEFTHGQTEDLKRELQALLEKDWNYLYEQELKSHEEDYFRVSDPYYRHRNYSRFPSDFLIMYHYEELLWLQDRNIEPVFPIHYFGKNSIYDFLYDDPTVGDVHESMSNKYSTKSIFFIYKFFHIFLSVAGIIFCLFFFGDIITKEKLNAYGPINFLYTQPISRRAIYISKFLTVLLISCFLFIGIILLSLILGSIFNGLGAWDYPILVYQPDKKFILIPILFFLIKALVLFFSLLLFAYSLQFFFSLVIKRTIFSLGITLGILILGITFSGEPTTLMSSYNPFQYFNVFDVVSKKTAAIYENFHLNWKRGILSSMMISALLMIGSYPLTKPR